MEFDKQYRCICFICASNNIKAALIVLVYLLVKAMKATMYLLTLYLTK